MFPSGLILCITRMKSNSSPPLTELGQNNEQDGRGKHFAISLAIPFQGIYHRLGRAWEGDVPETVWKQLQVCRDHWGLKGNEEEENEIA